MNTTNTTTTREPLAVSVTSTITLKIGDHTFDLTQAEAYNLYAKLAGVMFSVSSYYPHSHLFGGVAYSNGTGQVNKNWPVTISNGINAVTTV